MINKHIEHVEDMLFTKGVVTPLANLSSVLDVMLVNFTSSYIDISLKWDGAPAIVFGPDPENGKFFVGAKSVFAGKVNYTNDDIDRNHPNPELNSKLKFLLANLPVFGLEYIVQGDMMWWEGLLVEKDYYICFKPNVLEYRVKKNSYFGDEISKSKSGVVLHTRYAGASWKDLHVVYDTIRLHTQVNPNILLFVNNNHWLDILTSFNPLTDRAKEQLEEVHDRISNGIFNTDASLLCHFLSDEKLQKIVQKYLNYCIKTKGIPNADLFLVFLIDEYSNHIATLKTEKGRDKVLNEMVYYLDKLADDRLQNLFDIYNDLVRIKILLLQALNLIYYFYNPIEVYFSDGTKTTNEGIVVNLSGKTCKFINRSEFSYHNFTDKKDWK